MKVELRGARTALAAERRLRRQVFRPKPRLTLSQWAEKYRKIPAGTSPHPGNWRNSHVPYLVDIMDDLTDDAVEHVVFMKSARVGSTEAVLNLVGFTMHYKPTSIGVMQPTQEDADGFSKEQLDPMLQESEVLRSNVPQSGRREKDVTLRNKKFPGGRLHILYSGSANALRRRNIQIIIGDEVDGYEISARGGASREGDPFSLFIKRSQNYWNRTIFEGSTPTVAGASRIEKSWETSSQAWYYVPCPHCDHMQTLKWANFRWENQDPETVHYVCGKIDADTGELLEGCGETIYEKGHKRTMVQAGEWRHDFPERKVHGYRIWAAYSLLSSWTRMVDEWLKAQGDREKLVVFINTVLGETWKEDDKEQLDSCLLSARSEPYEAEVPKRVAVLTAGVDVQGDRLEVSVWGFGPGMESYKISHQQLWGDPAKADVWEQLDLVLTKQYVHELGITLSIRRSAVDSGGHHTQEVHDYCDPRNSRGVYAVKGSSVAGAVAAQPPSKRSAHKLWMVGTDTIKDTIFSGLRSKVIGPNYVHFPKGTPEEYYKQLTAEVPRTRYIRGKPIRRYEIKGYERNEALDCFVYAHAALHTLGPVKDKLGLALEKLEERAKTGAAPAPVRRRGRRVRSAGVM